MAPAPDVFVLLVFLVSNEGEAASDNDDFATWLKELRVEARQKGISEAVLDDALNGIAPLPRVIELDRSQPEFSLTFEEYLARLSRQPANELQQKSSGSMTGC